MERNPVTPPGYDALVKDLQYHKSVLRPSIVRDIEEARAHGDISENSEFEDAKERQAHCEGRIRLLEHLIATAQIIDPAKMADDGRVRFGATVLISRADKDDERELMIVGETEANIEAGRISYKAPVARALIGREEGDECVVPAPGGATTWEIVEVRYGG